MKNILLIRGLAREARHWGAFPQRLEEGLEEVKAFTLDLPGVGTEVHRKSPVTVPDIIADIRERWLPIRDANPGPWHLFGISFGGMVSMGWVMAHPTDFVRLTLCNTSAANLGLPHQRIRPRALAGLAQTMRIADPLEREREVLALISNVPEKYDEIAREWAEFARDASPGRSLVVRQILAAGGFRAPRSFAVPTMLLMSEQDRFTGTHCMNRLSDRLGVPTHRHPTAGHAMSVDDPDWIVARMADWMG